MKTLTGCWASFLALCGVHHLRQSNILIILSRVHSAQLWLPRHNGRVQLGTYTVWILTLSIAEFETGTTWGSGVEFDLYGYLKPYLEITFSWMKVLENWGKNVFTDEITLQFVKDMGNVGTNIKRQQCNHRSIYEILGECGNKLSLKKEFRAQQRFLLQILLLAQHVTGTTMPISWGLCVRFAGCCSILQTGHITLSSTPDQQLENHSTKYQRQQPLYNTPELLMMGIVVPETCWASNKICNKNLCCARNSFFKLSLFPHSPSIS